MRLVIAEDSGLLRDSLTRLLVTQGFEIVDAVGDADALVEAVRRDVPDLVLTDVRMPPGYGDEGLRAAATLRSELPELGILVLSTYVEPAYAATLLEAGGAGRIGYLLKDRVTDVDALVEAMHRVARGETVVDPTVVEMLLRRPCDDDFDALSAREREILALVAEGRSNEAISARLYLSKRTVEGHMASIFDKLGLRPQPDDHRRVLAVLRHLEHA